ncbi:MAG: aminoglycoside phosphotransferase family protein [Actinobacteria bacterium]|nr:aminoglycoside phosphotransferase family protein [Actinomycetota bacterium]
MERVAFESTAIELYASRSSWDATAADLVRTMIERWGLVPGAAFVGGEAASVLQVTTSDGMDAVLKVGFPHVEGVGEAIALESWGPDLAPRVLRQDPWTWSLLLERLRPGTSLRESSLPVLERVRIGSDLLRRISAVTAPPQMPTVTQIVGIYLSDALARLDDQHSTLVALGALDDVERGLAVLESLAATESGTGFVHGDLNPNNVLDAQGRWMVIDPKPMTGGPEFDVWPLATQLGDPRDLDQRLAVTGFTSDRTVLWGVARSALDVTWAVMDSRPAAEAVRVLRAWMRLSGA